MQARNAHSIAVLAGQGEGLGFLLDCPHLRAGGLGSHRQPDRARAGAQVDDASLTVARDDRHRLVNREAGKNLGLRAHDEHTGAGGQGQTTEEHATRDVLKRNAQGPLPHRRTQFPGLVLVQLRRQVPLGRGVTRPLEQLTYVRINGVDPRLRQAFTCPRTRVRDGPRPHVSSNHD